MDFKKNDIVQVLIEDMGHEGEGIGKAAGYTLFIKDAIIGDVVEASIMKIHKNYAYAKLKKVVTPSSFRVAPRCAFHKECGGCRLQAMHYEKQLEYKQNLIRNNLIRIGGFAPQEVDRVMEPIIGMTVDRVMEPIIEMTEGGGIEPVIEITRDGEIEPVIEIMEGRAPESVKAMAVGKEAGIFRYRNKAQFPVGYDKEGKLITGFYAGRTHSIIANTDCYLGVKENKEILEAILKYMQNHGIRAYNEKDGTGLVRHILIRSGFSSGEIMVCLVINGKELPRQQALIDVLKAMKGMSSILISVNQERSNVIMGKEIRKLWGRGTIRDTIYMRDPANDFAFTGSWFTFEISPLSFYQVNPLQTEKIYSIALEFAALTKKDVVWDIYCGIGTISLFMAEKAGQVYGIEIVSEAVEDARKNAAANGIKNVEFFSGRAEAVLPEKYEREGIAADVIVVDPPRKGCDEACLETMVKMKPERIIYISCDSATLSRDLKILCEGGYKLQRVRGGDMFPHTTHVETIVSLCRRDT